MIWKPGILPLWSRCRPYASSPMSCSYAELYPRFSRLRPLSDSSVWYIWVVYVLYVCIQAIHVLFVHKALSWVLAAASPQRQLCIYVCMYVWVCLCYMCLHTSNQCPARTQSFEKFSRLLPFSSNCLCVCVCMFMLCVFAYKPSMSCSYAVLWLRPSRSSLLQGSSVCVYECMSVCMFASISMSIFLRIMHVYHIYIYIYIYIYECVSMYWSIHIRHTYTHTRTHV